MFCAIYLTYNERLVCSKIWDKSIKLSKRFNNLNIISFVREKTKHVGCGESIKDSVFGGSVLGGSVFLTSDILRRPHKPNP